jgi:hypothetical protein
MLFQSHIFLLVFLPLALAVCYFAGDRQRLRWTV